MQVLASSLRTSSSSGAKEGRGGAYTFDGEKLIVMMSKT